MIIGIDGNEANVQHRVGVSVYTYELLKYFHSKSHKDLKFRVYLRNKPYKDLPAEHDFFSYTVVRSPFLWINAVLPMYLSFDKKIDLFFSPAHYVPRFVKIPTVVTIHDLSYILYPEEFVKKELYKLINWTRYAVNQSQKIIAVSNTTKDDICHYYTIPEEKITVIYNGFTRRKMCDDKKIIDIQNVNIYKDPYFLFVGTVQPRKNIQTILHAFKLLLKKNPELKLIIVGKKGWLYDKIFTVAQELHLEKSAVFTNFIPEEDIPYLYCYAQSLILPSLYEGFGLPILEAMSLGCPVIASNTSSLPEIGGNACLYVNPLETLELKEAMETLLTDSKRRNDLIAKGKVRIQDFSWEKCGKETLKLLTSAAHKRA